jgi:hypothetical protein
MTGNAVRIGDETSGERIEVAPSDERHADGLIWDCDADTKNAIDSLVRLAIEVGSTAAVVELHLYLLKFSPQTLEALHRNELHRSFGNDGMRAWVVNSHTRRIVEHGFLQSPTAIKEMMIVTLIWHVMAIVTQQHYLHQINCQLESLRVGVDAILQSLEEDRRTKLLGNVKYLQDSLQILQDVRTRESDVALLKQQIESIERESVQIAEGQKEQVSIEVRRLRALAETDPTSFAGIKAEFLKLIQAMIPSIEQRFRTAYFAVLTRVIAAEQASIHGSAAFIDARLGSIVEDIRAIEHEYREAHDAVENALNTAYVAIANHPLIRRHRELQNWVTPEIEVKAGGRHLRMRLSLPPVSVIVSASAWAAYRQLHKEQEMLDVVRDAAMVADLQLRGVADEVTREIAVLEGMITTTRQAIVLEAELDEAGKVVCIRTLETYTAGPCKAA